jgi:hypothetical protein
MIAVPVAPAATLRRGQGIRADISDLYDLFDFDRDHDH